MDHRGVGGRKFDSLATKARKGVVSSVQLGEVVEGGAASSQLKTTALDARWD